MLMLFSLSGTEANSMDMRTILSDFASLISADKSSLSQWVSQTAAS